MSHLINQQASYTCSIPKNIIQKPFPWQILHQKKRDKSWDRELKRSFNGAGSDKWLEMIKPPVLYPNGLWLELFNLDSLQLYQLSICSAPDQEKITQKDFALPNGLSSFFWSLEIGHCSNKSYVQLIRDEKHLLQWNFP